MTPFDVSDAVLAFTPSLSTLTTVRDWVIIVSGTLLVLLLFAALAVTLVLGISVRMLLGTVRGLITGEVQPIAHSARETVDSVRGTTTFINEAVARPIVRLYGLIAGLRRILAVLLGLTGRRRSP